MYYGARESWNLRDRHMFATLQSVLEHRGPKARAVVWAHNSHVGDATATEMAARGETNLGKLARHAFGAAAYLIGMGTDRGTVAAASGNMARAWYTQNKATVPIAPRQISRPRRCPQAGTPARRSNHQLRPRLTTARASTTSLAGMRPPTCLTQTPINEKKKALATMASAAGIGLLAAIGIPPSKHRPAAVH